MSSTALPNEGVAAAPAAGVAGASPLRRILWTAIAITLAFRLWLAWWLPITGDEAYFIYWGAAPDLGFYDHPPMVGWLLAAALQLSHAKLVVRLPAIVLPAIIALGIAWTVRALVPNATGPARGDAAALAWLLVPAQVLNVVITTDTPLTYFSFLSYAALALGVRRDSTLLACLAGVALGLAVLSKYFAGILALAFLGWALFAPRGGRSWRTLAYVYAAAAPFILVNVAWNYEHCWANLLFNLYNRHADARFAWHKPLMFLAFVLYVSSPLLVVHLIRNARAMRDAARDPALAVLMASAFLPLVAFAFLAPVKNIGLHWLFSFTPALFMAAGAVLAAERLIASAKFLAGFSALHVVALIAFAALPIETWRHLRAYDGIVMTFQPDELLSALRPYERRFVFAADGYSPAVTLSYNAAVAGVFAQPATHAWRQHYFFVFGPGSAHARHDDILTDFRALDGRDILVVRKTRPDPAAYERFFRAVAFQVVAVRGAVFHLVLGYGFDYPAYRDGVLAEVRDRYYRIPAYLPQGRCYFCERYFGYATCPTH